MNSQGSDEYPGRNILGFHESVDLERTYKMTRFVSTMMVPSTDMDFVRLFIIMWRCRLKERISAHMQTDVIEVDFGFLTNAGFLLQLQINIHRNLRSANNDCNQDSCNNA